MDGGGFGGDGKVVSGGGGLETQEQRGDAEEWERCGEGKTRQGVGRGVGNDT